MVTVKAAIVLLILFLLITDKTRNIILGAVSAASRWITGMPPASQTIFAILLGALALGLFLLARWPKARPGRNPQ